MTIFGTMHTFLIWVAFLAVYGVYSFLQGDYITFYLYWTGN